MSNYDLFLSYNWRDRQDAERIGRQLQGRGLRVFMDCWYLVPGRPWMEALEELIEECSAVVVLVGPDGMGSWQQRERDLALSRQHRDTSFQVIPVLLPGADFPLGFLSLATWVDLRKGIDDESLGRIQLAVRSEPPDPDDRRRMRNVRSSICPYRGLRPFREEDAPYFFGREEYTQRLVEMTKRNSLITIIGASGSGKSSVVRAGLVPTVRKGFGNQVCEVAILVPGESPFQSLSATLIPMMAPEMSAMDRLLEVNKLSQALLNQEVALYDLVARVLEKQPGTNRLLLVVDQWEEIYTLCDNHWVRTRFINELMEATQSGSLCAVLTLRGNFFGQALEHRQLADRLQNQVVNLGPMTREELGQAIEQPAHQVGLELELGLSERLQGDVRNEPGSLPYLEFVLTQLWERRRANLLTHEAYEDLGSMQGALSQQAESQIRNALTQGRSEEMVRDLFLQLIQVGDSGVHQGRRARLFDLEKAARPIALELADARLLVSSRDELTGEETVQLAHEALFHGWARLRHWVNEEREFLHWRARMRTYVADWLRTGRDPGVLFRGALLKEAEHWHEAKPELLDSDEIAFISESQDVNSQLGLSDTLTNMLDSLGLKKLERYYQQKKESYEKLSKEYDKLLLEQEKQAKRLARLRAEMDLRQSEIDESSPTIFMSYAKEDANAVEQIYERLETKGLKPWMDLKKIEGGQEWARVINSALRHSDFVVVFLSSRTVNKRGFIQREIRSALDLFKELPPGSVFVIPARLENCQVPDELQKYHYVNLFEEDGFERLVRAIATEWSSRTVGES